MIRTKTVLRTKTQQRDAELVQQNQDNVVVCIVVYKENKEDFSKVNIPINYDDRTKCEVVRNEVIMRN